MDFWTLLRIELKRSRVWILLVVFVAALAVTDMRRFFGSSFGGVSWFWIGGAAGELTSTFPFGVAFASWYAGRARRNRLSEVETSNRWLGLGSHAPALTSMVLTLAVIVIPVFGIVSIRIRQTSIEKLGTQPIGPYPWLQIVVILVAFAAFVMWGYWLGYKFGSVLIPIVSAAAMLLLLQIPRSTTTEGNTNSVLGAIIPTQISYEMAPFIGDHVYLPLAAWGIAWFLLLALIPVLMLRKWGFERKRAALLLTFVSLLAIFCASNVTSAFKSAGSWHANNRTQTCLEQSGINYCGPPGALSSTDLDAISFHYEQLIPDWYPTSLLPKKLSFTISGNQLPAGAVSMVHFEQSLVRNPAGFTRALLYFMAGEGVIDLEPSAAQLVVACAMLLDTGHDCGPTYPVADFQFVPNASSSVEGQKLLAPLFEPGKQPTEDEEREIVDQLEELQALAQQKLDSFIALSDEEKSAWLEENWDQLRSGELTLDDMP